MLAQHANDLILGKSASPHHSPPSDELTYQWHDFWGAGHTFPEALDDDLGDPCHSGTMATHTNVRNQGNVIGKLNGNKWWEAVIDDG
jgi:hypothetical protein